MVTPERRERSLDDWLARLETLHPKKIDMSLERVIVVLDRLRLRPPPYRAIIVGGTNGKGSCVAMLESIYWHAGYKVGTFTSPHLWRFNERIRVDGHDASDAELVELFEVIDAALGTVTLSYFESSAVAALLHFARSQVDVAVLEVGMGGRLDAVNAIDADASLIASVDLDHMEWLGPDREAIGHEKAGVFRAGRPAVVADRNPPASVPEHAARLGADLRLIGRDFDYAPAADGWHETVGASTEAIAPARQPVPSVARSSAGGSRGPEAAPTATASSAAPVGAASGPRPPPPSNEAALSPPPVLWPLPPFGGAEQYANAAACVTVVRALQAKLPVREPALAAGIRGARLRARFERHTVDGVEWIFDVAHNPAAAAVLHGSLAKLPPAARTLAVFAAMHDKDLAGVLRPFAADVDRWFVAQADPERGAPPALLEERLASVGARNVRAAADVPAAVALARASARPGDRVVAFGSFHTVGAATAALGLYSAPSPLGTPPATWTRV